MPRSIRRRKADHLELCATDRVAFRDRTTLLECVELIHDSLPELALDEVDLRMPLFGKQLAAPILISGMTGGTRRAGTINRDLARVAEALGLGFGLGSQRAMLEQPTLAATYRVRAGAPKCLLLANIGVVQARSLGRKKLEALVRSVGADALCIHMNPAMEIVQAEGDRDFRGCADALGEAARELSVPVVAKETGSGIGPGAAAKIAAAGVRWVDVAGAGGTSWVGVETLRRPRRARARAVGEALWDWGVPTAAAVLFARGAGLRAIASGGVKTGLDVARALALGADAASIARPVLQAYERGGAAHVETYLRGVVDELRAVMLLSGASSVAALQESPRLLRGELREWAALARSAPSVDDSRAERT